MMIKKILKDTGISIIMILNFILVFLLVINVITLDSKRRLSENNLEKYNTKYSYSLTVSAISQDGSIVNNYSPENMVDDSYNAVMKFPGNVIRSGYFAIKSKNANVTNGSINCVIKNDEEIMIDTIDGNTHIYEVNSSETGVYIHELFTDNVYNIDGIDYINMNGASIPVKGVKKDYSLDYSDTKMYVFANGLDDNQKKNLLYDYDNIDVCEEMNFQLNSNYECSDSVEKIQKELSDIGYVVSVVNSNSYKVDKSFNLSNDLSKIIYIVLIVFSLINCIYISNVWILRQQREIVIRKTFGQLMRVISFNIFSEIFLKLLLAIIGAIIIQMIALGGIDKEIISLRTCGLFLVAIVLVLLINVISPIIKINKLQPVVGLKEM